MRFNVMVVVLAILFSDAVGQTEGKNYMIEGGLTGAENRMIYLSSYSDELIVVDSAKISNGKFVFKGVINQPSYYLLQLKPTDQGISFFWSQGKLL